MQDYRAVDRVIGGRVTNMPGNVIHIDIELIPEENLTRFMEDICPVKKRTCRWFRRSADTAEGRQRSYTEWCGDCSECRSVHNYQIWSGQYRSFIWVIEEIGIPLWCRSELPARMVVDRKDAIVRREVSQNPGGFREADIQGDNQTVERDQQIPDNVF